PMVEEARTVLAELGVPAERVHRELFFVDEPPPPVQHAEAPATGETREVTLTIDGRSSTAALPRDRSILDGAQAVRSDLQLSCHGGGCGPCAHRVKDSD